MISRSPQEQIAYEARLKFQRDEATRLAYARLERLEGERIGREEGLSKGREIGALIGQIQLLQKMLGVPKTDELLLSRLDAIKLTNRLGELQGLWQKRGG